MCQNTGCSGFIGRERPKFRADQINDMKIYIILKIVVAILKMAEI
jgi:hypothetical protein